MPCGATQDGQVMVQSSNKTWSTGEGNGKPLQHSCLENPMNSMKRQKDMTLEDEPQRLEDVQYATEGASLVAQTVQSLAAVRET